MVEYAGKRETIPVIEDLSTLEYDLTSAIRKLTRDRLPVAGILTGHGEPGRTAIETFWRALERNYEVRTVSVKDSTLDPRPDVLFIIAPTDTFPEAHLKAIDRYLMEGGRVAVLLNRINANLQFGFASEQKTGLEDLLAHYGAVVRPDLVMDRQSSVVTLQRTVGFFRVAQMVEYPFFPIATSFNPEHPMVSRLREVFFYYVSSIDTSAALPEGSSAFRWCTRRRKVPRNRASSRCSPPCCRTPKTSGTAPTCWPWRCTGHSRAPTTARALGSRPGWWWWATAIWSTSSATAASFRRATWPSC